MTGLLTDVLRERADAAPMPPIDLDAIVRVGDRRVRRRRLATGVAAVVVAGAVATGSLTASHLWETEGSLAADGFVPTREPTFATGSTIHEGSRSFDVGVPVASYVQTDAGVVLTSHNGDVRFYDGTTSDVVGRAEGGRLSADDSGSLVAWTERADDGHPQYVVHDFATGDEVARVDDQAAGASIEPSDQGAEIFAVDDGSVYWSHGSDLVRYDVESGAETVVGTATPWEDPATKDDAVVTRLLDAASGTLAWTVDGGPRWGIAAGAEIDTARPVLAEATTGHLSPDGRLLAAEEHDTLSVYATDDGQALEPTVEGYRYHLGFAWTGDDVLAVLALREYDETTASGDILRCDISDDACTVVASFDRLPTESFVLPGGRPVS